MKLSFTTFLISYILKFSFKNIQYFLENIHFTEQPLASFLGFPLYFDIFTRQHRMIEESHVFDGFFTPYGAGVKAGNS